MFNITKLFLGDKTKNGNALTKEEIAKLLGTKPKLLKKFEDAYTTEIINSEPDSLFDYSKKMADEKSVKYDDSSLEGIEEQIVNNLLSKYDGEKYLPDNGGAVITSDDVKNIPVEIRPQLISGGYCIDCDPNSSAEVLFMYKKYIEEKDPAKKKMFYNHFRQGVDILDLDMIIYEILGMNKNSMGYWFPKLKEAADSQTFFKVPKTKIIKVPIEILQMSRLQYETLTPATKKIVNDFCMKTFDLDVNKSYFVKTGVFSSKFDFRNAKVTGEKEVRELGEYLLFISNQASQMAGPLSQPSIYGAATTNEWVVREYIEDVENNPTIYKGLPLHTEYRLFVDFDTDEVLSIVPYWDPQTMKRRFSLDNDIHERHDYIIYMMHEETLMERYNQNKDKVLSHAKELVKDVDLHGQWSLDIMQNGDDFYLIDMGVAENSAFYQSVPVEKRVKMPEDWLPKLAASI